MSDLRQLAADLAFAAGPGAAHLASSVARGGKQEAEIGGALPASPGPALQSILARHGGVATAQSQGQIADVGAVASHMAVEAADQGVALLMGKR